MVPWATCRRMQRWCLQPLSMGLSNVMQNCVTSSARYMGTFNWVQHVQGAFVGRVHYCNPNLPFAEYHSLAMRPLTFDQAWIKDGRRLSGAAVVPRKPASCDSNDDDDAPAYMKFLEDTPRTKQTTALQSYNSSLLCQAENDGARRTPARTASKHLARHLTHKDALLNYADQRQSAISELRRTHSNSSSSTSTSTAPYNIPSYSTAAKSPKQAATSNRTPTAAPKTASHTRTSSQPVWSSSDDDSDLGDNVTTAAARRRRDRVSAMYDKMTTTTPHSTMTFGRLRQQTPSEAAASSTTSISTSSTISARVAAAAASLSSTSTSSIGTSVISPSLCRSPPSVTLMHGYPDGDDGIEPDACPCEACAARIAVRRSATYQALAAGPPASQLRSAIGPASSRSSGGAPRVRTPVAVHFTSHTPRMSSSSRQYQKRQQEKDERRLQHLEVSGSQAADRYPSAAALLSLSSGGSSRRNLQETRDDDEDRRRQTSYDLPYHLRSQNPRDYRELLFGAAGGLKGGLKHVAATPMSHSRQQKVPIGGSRMLDFFLSEGGATAAAVAEARCSSRLAAPTAARRRTAVDYDVGLDCDVEEATLRPDYVSPANLRHSRRGVWELSAAAARGPKDPTMSNMDGGGGRGSRHGRQETDLASETVVLMSDSSEDELVRRVASFARRGGGDGGGAAFGPQRGPMARDQWAAEAATAAAAAAARVASRVRRTLAGTPGSLSRRMLQTDLLRPGASRSSSSVASTSKRSVSSARSTCSNRSGGSGGSRRSGGSVSHRGERQHLGDGAGRWLMTEALRSPGYGDGYDGPHDGSSDGVDGRGRVGATRSPSQRLQLSAVWGGAGGGPSGGGRRSSGRPPRSPPSATGDSAASAAALKRWLERYGSRTAGAGSSYGSQRRVDGVTSSRRVLQF